MKRGVWSRPSFTEEALGLSLKELDFFMWQGLSQGYSEQKEYEIIEVSIKH